MKIHTHSWEKALETPRKTSHINASQISDTITSIFPLATRANEPRMNDKQQEALDADPVFVTRHAPAFKSAFAQHGTVTLLVGFDEDLLVAHKTYLTKNSEFFEAAMKKRWGPRTILSE